MAPSALHSAKAGGLRLLPGLVTPLPHSTPSAAGRGSQAAMALPRLLWVWLLVAGTQGELRPSGLAPVSLAGQAQCPAGDQAALPRCWSLGQLRSAQVMGQLRSRVSSGHLSR